MDKKVRHCPFLGSIFEEMMAWKLICLYILTFLLKMYRHLQSFFFFFFFLPCQVACRIVVPQVGVRPMAPALGVWSPNQADREEEAK